MTKAAGIVSASTFISRIFGLVRDLVFAWFFGAGIYADAFIAAFRIPNLLRRLFGEGSLSIAFVPVFSEYLANKGEDEAFKMARSAIRLLSIILFVVALCGIIAAPFIIRAIAPGFTESPEKFEITVTLTRIMFPYTIFICMVALCMGILNALGHFAAPALAPVLLNIAMISSMVIVSFVSLDGAARIKGLSIGVLAGGALQLSLQLPFLIKKRFYFWKKAALYHPGLKKVAGLMLSAVFGAAVYQINVLVGTLLASLLPEGSISYLYYADRLVQFPLGIFGIAIATAVLPSLSRQAAAKDFDSLRDTFAHAIKLVFFITIPSMTGLIILREPIVALLFKRGAFDLEASRLTASALLYYSVGLWAFSGVRIVVSTFYALQDAKTPVRTAAISIIVNIILGIILMQPLGHRGLALATSLSSMLNFGLLIFFLRSRLGSFGWKGICLSACKTLICSVFMGIFVWGVSRMIIPREAGTMIELFGGIFSGVLTGFIMYSIFSLLLKSTELKFVISLIKNGVIKN